MGQYRNVFGPSRDSRYLRGQRPQRADGYQRNIQRKAQALGRGAANAQAGVGTGPVAHGYGGEVA